MAKQTNDIANAFNGFIRGLVSQIREGKTDKFDKYIAWWKNTGYRYSPGNAMSIFMTYGFSANTCYSRNIWLKKHKRKVKENARGAPVWVPKMAGQLRDEKTGEYIPGTGRCFGFTVGLTYDISQTTGPELPELQITQGEVNDNYIKLLNFCTKTLRIPVAEKEELGKAKGCYYPNSKKIHLSQDLETDAEKFSVLAHEIGHALLHTDKYGRKLKSEQKELEAETVAFLMGKFIGLDNCEKTSGDYLLSWQFDEKTLNYSMKRIFKIAGKMAKVLN